MQTMPHPVRTALVAERHRALTAAAASRHLAGTRGVRHPNLIAAIRRAMTRPKHVVMATRP
jgi:hypothetical protein